MKARVLRGSKQEIAAKVAQIDGEIREVIVFVEEPMPPIPPTPDIFTEMEPFTVQQTAVDDSREAVYGRMAGE